MINRLLYVATATALISVFMFDENFAANLSQAIGEPIDMWEVGAAGIVVAAISAIKHQLWRAG